MRRRAPRKAEPYRPLTDALRISELATRQLEWAESRRSWFYFNALLNLLHVLGARVMRLETGGYVVEYSNDDSDGA